jgi:predicted dehydrogenase
MDQSTPHRPAHLRGVGAGAGYFSHYQYEAWRRIPEVAITALYNRTQAKAEALMAQYAIPRCYAGFQAMLAQEQPDFVDIITPPETHYAFCEAAIQAGVHIICQKPLAPTYAEGAAIVAMVQRSGVRFMVHENWRWQPWYRAIKTLIEQGVLGEIFSIYFRMRMGDGWKEDAYLARQPFFRDYPRLLVYETGVHFIDTFRYLLGEVETVYARLRRLNPVIRGEDSGQVVLGFANGATAILDGNRYNENEARNPRLTFGEMRIDGSKGHLLLDTEGEITIKLLGEPAYQHAYPYADRGFAGDCVYAVQRHFVDQFLAGEPFESSGLDYLKTMKVVEACYASATSGQAIHLDTWQPAA